MSASDLLVRLKRGSPVMKCKNHQTLLMNHCGLAIELSIFGMTCIKIDNLAPLITTGNSLPEGPLFSYRTTLFSLENVAKLTQ